MRNFINIIMVSYMIVKIIVSLQNIMLWKSRFCRCSHYLGNFEETHSVSQKKKLID